MNKPELEINNSVSQVVQTREFQVQNTEGKKQDPIGILQYFRFANCHDYIFIVIGIVFSIGLGALSPMFSLLWGDMLDSLAKRQEIVGATFTLLRFYSLIGLLALAISWVMNTCWMMTAKRQSLQCRKKYFTSILSQQMGWFDCSDQKELKSQLMKQTLVFEEGMIGSFSNLLFLASLAISNLIFSLIKGWLLSLVVISLIPLFIFAMNMGLKLNMLKQLKQEKTYSKAAGVAEESLSAIKTIKALNGQKFQSARYDKTLNRNGDKKHAILFGLSFGGIYTSLIFMFGLGFWFGANCLYQTQHCPAGVSKQKYTAGIIISVLFSILMIGLNLSRLPIAFRKLMEGRSAAARIFKIIDRQPKIKNPENGKKIENFVGIIEFHNVSFAYPKQPSKKILNGINLRIDKHNNALVGDSGCGKSTILQLLMRFYDPDEGHITVDGHNLKQLDLVWWRNTIGYVGQQPVLFIGSIRDNLTFSKEEASDQEVKEALKKAEVWEFISQLQKTIHTQVGEGGGQISGGQKQRIAIARALIKKPKIMFLDEATSALDVRTERKIQKTLNKISKEIVTVTVAHRLNTIKHADEIFCLKEGIVAQKGRFNELKRFEKQKQKYLKKRVEKKQEQQPSQKNQKIEKQPQPLAYSVISQSNMDMSVSEGVSQFQQQYQNQKKQNKFSFRRILSYLKGNVIVFLIGLFVTAIFGAIFPVFSVLLSEILVSLMKGQRVLDEVNLRTWIIFGMGVLALITGALQTIIFEGIGTKLSLKIRSETFYKLLRLPISFFQKKQNTVGEISSKLGIGCYHMKQFTTVYVYAIFQNIFTLLAAIGISLYYQWHTGLVFVALIPLSIGATAVRAYYNSNFAKENVSKQKKELFNPNQVFSNIRTVRSLGYERVFTQIYRKSLNKVQQNTIKTCIAVGFFYGLTEFLGYFISAFILYIGAVFMVNLNVPLLNMITAVFALNFASQSIGNNSQMIPDASKCKQSIGNLFEILDTEDQEGRQISTRSKMIKDRKISNSIVFRNVSFRHKSRRHLFRKFNLVIPFGQKVGFVGDSGCGKSTIFSLLLRFYQPSSGQILLDDINIKDYDIHFLRSMFGIVQQEPVLFNTSILENVRYNLENVPQSKVYESLATAQALAFIQNQAQNLSHSQQIPALRTLSSIQSSVSMLPEQSNRPIKPPNSNTGIYKNVGPKGSHISGGQKQRLAIARTILRQPTVLLMDEATSNLDSINQQKVQKNLDRHLKDRLFIVIAHRLETIQNSDTIFVFREGEIAQSGKYDELLEKQGYFYKLTRGV